LNGESPNFAPSITPSQLDFVVTLPFSTAHNLSSQPSVQSSSQNFENKLFSFYSDITSNVPRNPREAMQSPSWKASYISELESLIKHDVFRVISAEQKPSQARLFNLTWVFRVKESQDGTRKIQSQMLLSW
jgi:hypothetical protein